MTTRPPLFLAPLPLLADGTPQIKKVLIANRGEIACRIAATCRKLNIVSVAIYADEDASSQHVLSADEAVCVGAIQQEGGNPFLNINLLVNTALSVNADAVHPGYGYLSENGEFADAVRHAGLIFVGPSATAMSTLGDKRTSKEYLRQHEPRVPLIPGFAGSSQNVEDLEQAAQEIGFPVMLKASAGGGGRGMRIVRERSQLRDELQSAQSEAQRSFGSSDCILEKYIEAGKHIEVQIMGDAHGNVLSLWERECSVQRRHQKIIEETPSPWLRPEQRKALCDTAVRIGQLLHYEGAGTVEFVVDVSDGRFYFLEVNTRLQVEHPITEEVTGVDAVGLQLYVAAGGNLTDLGLPNPLPQNGHAIECRLCAEEPRRNFMPEHGTIYLWQPYPATPSEARDIRFETAVRTGAEVSIFFDSMIAKIIVWAPTRSAAIAKMARVMAMTACVGVHTNQLFLQSCLLHPEFRNPAYTTSFIPNHLTELLRNPHHDTQGLAHQETLLPLVAASLLRDSPAALTLSASQTSLKNGRKAFKNQGFDRVNVSARIVKEIETHQSPSPVLLVWHPQQSSQATSATVSMTALEDVWASGTTAASTTSEVTSRYNALSQRLRRGMLSESTSLDVQWKSGKVVATDIQPLAARLGSGTWTATSFEALVGPHRMSGYLVVRSRSSASDGGQDIFCHIPLLGTWFGYRSHSVLSFFESLRDDVAAANATQPTSVKAPMPCKVLSVLKEIGDDVKSGDTVMVVESMKMEMNISMGMDGKFQTSVSKGDSVDEGTVLCWVKEATAQ